MANTDALTKLPNRQNFCNVVKKHLESTKHQETHSCLAMLDLDGFKRINDTYGHRTGDEVLQRFAAFLRNHLDPKIFIGRYGGDEFVLLFPETHEEEAETQLQGARNQMDDEPFFKMYELSFTFGITSLTHDSDDEMDVLDVADKIMMKRKNHRQQTS
jgi:diguanylate cyclase (GGDEF)-like protein